MNIENQPGMRLGRRATEEFLRGSKGPRLKEHNDERIAAVLSAIIHQRIRWRTANQLSQAQAAHVLVNAGLPVSVRL